MRVLIAKRAGGAGVLRCIRSDGSETWQKQKETQAGFFALHDLTHFAVETTLGFRKGFFGLVAEGWDIEETTGKGSRGPLPPETVEVEQLVNLFFTERAGGTVWSADDFNSVWSSSRRLTDTDLIAVRRCRQILWEQWAAVLANEVLELKWDSRL